MLSCTGALAASLFGGPGDMRESRAGRPDELLEHLLCCYPLSVPSRCNRRMAVQRRTLVEESNRHIVLANNVGGIFGIPCGDLTDEAGTGLRSAVKLHFESAISAKA